MSRRRRATKRKPLPDSKYGNELVTKFITKLMKSGKKSIAETIVYKSLEILSKETNTDAVEAFLKTLKNVTPLMEVKSRRVGGSTYQVPVEVRGDRGTALAMRWLIGHARSRSGHTMVERLSKEMIDAFNNTGVSVKKREDTHKMAEANKAFAHFRW